MTFAGINLHDGKRIHVCTTSCNTPITVLMSFAYVCLYLMCVYTYACCFFFFVRSLVNKQKSLRWRRLANQTYAGQHVTEAEAPIAGSGIKGQKGALQSVTDRRELDEFLVEAMLQEEQFEAEHSSMVILSTEAVAKKEYDALKANNFEYPEIPIPRRPEWDEETTPDQLDRMEKDSFLRWRKSLADMEEEFNGKEITPFEKNLEVWKQL